MWGAGGDIYTTLFKVSYLANSHILRNPNSRYLISKKEVCGWKLISVENRFPLEQNLIEFSDGDTDSYSFGSLDPEALK